MDTKLMIFDLDGRCSIRSAIWRLAAIMCWLRGDCPCIPMRSIAVLSATALCGWSNGRCPRAAHAGNGGGGACGFRGLLYRTYRPFYVPTRVFRNCSGSWCSVESGWLSLPTNFKSVPRSWCGSISRRSVSMRFSVSAPGPAQTRSAGGAGDSRRYGCGIRSGAVRRGFGRRYGYGPGSRCPVGRCDLGLPRPGGVV